MKTIKRGIYKHFKGKLYRVIALARNSESPSDYVVVYKALYGDREHWFRPYNMFTEDVDPDHIRIVPRFRRLPWYLQLIYFWK